MSNRKIGLIALLMTFAIIAIGVFGAKRTYDHREELREKLLNAEEITYDAEALTFKIIEPNDTIYFEPNASDDLTFEIIEDPNYEELLVISPAKTEEYPLVATFNDNKVRFQLVGDEIICDRSPREAVEILYDCLCRYAGLEEDRDKEIRFEPNEPKKYSLPIPTWPDYIELEKDLVIVYDSKTKVSGYEKWDIITYPKGARIYFKDD